MLTDHTTVDRVDSRITLNRHDAKNARLIEEDNSSFWVPKSNRQGARNTKVGGKDDSFDTRLKKRHIEIDE